MGINIDSKYVEVSVIIPVYNEEKYIEKCINSLIDQNYPREKMEWIIIDGNSSDHTLEIIKQYINDYPIVLANNPKRKTPISLNIGIQKANGRYIVRFDAHTSFPNSYIHDCVECLEETGADNVGGYVVTKAEGYIGSAIAGMLSSRFGVGGSSFRVDQKSGYVDTVPFGTFKRTIFDKIGFFNEELLRSEDNDINARIIESGGKVYLSEKIHSTYYCRDSVSSLLKMGLQNGNALFRTIKWNPKAMKIRHFVPFLFVLSIIALLIGGLLFRPFHILLFAEMCLYLLIDLFYSFKRPNTKYGIITLWLYPLFHFSYGIGSLLGLVGINVY